MARPERNDVDYFPFYCSEGEKMYYLEETYGNDGFAIFVKLLRELAKSDYHYLDLSKNTTKMFLSAKCKVSKEVLVTVINDLVELGKFDSELWEENSIIWCQDFIDSIQDAYKKRSNSCIDRESLLDLLHSKGIRKPLKSTPKPLKSTSKGYVNPQSKVEYSKEDKIKENNIPSLSVFLDYALSKESKLDKKAVELKYDAWKQNNWRDGNDKIIKNWKVKLTNTIPYIKHNKKELKPWEVNVL